VQASHSQEDPEVRWSPEEPDGPVADPGQDADNLGDEEVSGTGDPFVARYDEVASLREGARATFRVADLAARLEGITKPGGVTLSQETYTHVRDMVTAEKSVAEVIPKPEPQILTMKGKTNKKVNKLPEEQPQEEPVRTVVDNSEQTEAIAKLMAEMSQQEERFAKRPRIHFIDPLSAKGTVEAEYIYTWSKKLERIGNINFPQKALDLSLSGTLILNTTLDRAGRVVEIQISVSSGSKILDDAAIKIVKLAAPYEPLPKKIRAKYDRLNITRTIVFHKAQGEKAVFSSN